MSFFDEQINKRIRELDQLKVNKRILEPFFGEYEKHIKSVVRQPKGAPHEYSVELCGSAYNEFTLDHFVSLVRDKIIKTVSGEGKYQYDVVNSKRGSHLSDESFKVRNKGDYAVTTHSDGITLSCYIELGERIIRVFFTALYSEFPPINIDYHTQMYYLSSEENLASYTSLNFCRTRNVHAEIQITFNSGYVETVPCSYSTNSKQVVPHQDEMLVTGCITKYNNGVDVASITVVLDDQTIQTSTVGGSLYVDSTPFEKF